MERDEVFKNRHSASGPEIQSVLIQTWKEVLEVPTVNTGDNFLLLGGESLLATQASVRLHERYGWDVSLRSVLVKTIAEIADEIVSSLESSEEAVGH
jgi:hypothetical protein